MLFFVVVLPSHLDDFGVGEEIGLRGIEDLKEDLVGGQWLAAVQVILAQIQNQNEIGLLLSRHFEVEKERESPEVLLEAQVFGEQVVPDVALNRSLFQVIGEELLLLQYHLDQCQFIHSISGENLHYFVRPHSGQ